MSGEFVNEMQQATLARAQAAEAEVEQLRKDSYRIFRAVDELGGAAVLNQDAHDENVSVTISIKDWRAFWTALDYRLWKRETETE